MLKIVYISEWQILTRDRTYKFLSDFEISCYFPHLKHWPLALDDKIRVVFSNATNFVRAALTLKHTGNKWDKDDNNSFINVEFKPLDVSLIEDTLTFKIEYAKTAYTGSYWCDTESSKKTARSQPIKLAISGT